MFTIGLGPFFGILNSGIDPIFKPGITILARFEIPGFIFLNFRTDNTQSYRSSQTLDYMQERLMLSFGFYVMNAICTVNYSNKRFTQSEGTSEVIDTLTEYAFKTLLFQKNVPYHIELSFAYQVLEKTFTSTPTETIHGLNSLIVGFRFEANFTDYLKYYIEMENSIYTFGQGELAGVFNPGIWGGYGFRGYTGFLLNFDKLLEPVRID
ncbi:MAG: hypothetical protein JW969_14285, partial [Spirochaetales bacterium]|nr:hypothetical protein [Spirochaetales bacterium]